MKDLKNKLKNNKLSIGSWITLGNSSIAEIMADADFEWLTIDMEHSVISLDQAQDMIRTIASAGKTPLVRVGENSQNLIKRAMDAGAHGVIVPMVNNKDDAMKAVKAVKYPPLGMRGVGLARAQGYGLKFEQYIKVANKNSVVIALIEHIKAIENLEEIISTPGIDGTLIGPYDLSGSLGIPGQFDHPKLMQAIKRYELVCQKLKKPMGFHSVPTEPQRVNQYIKKGYAFLAVGLDTLYLGNKCQEVINKIDK